MLPKSLKEELRELKEKELEKRKLAAKVSTKPVKKEELAVKKPATKGRPNKLKGQK